MSEHVLAVEDNPDIRAPLQSLLSDEYTLTFANDKQEALDLSTAADDRTQNLSLILSDVMMPRMDGYELLEKIKSHARWQRVPVQVGLLAEAGVMSERQFFREIKRLPACPRTSTSLRYGFKRPVTCCNTAHTALWPKSPTP